MKKCFFISTFLLLSGMSPVYSQVNLSDMDLASSDSLEKSRIRYFSPGKEGRDKVWDFTGKLSSKESSQVRFTKDSIGVVSIMEPRKTSYYRVTPDDGD